MRESKFRAWDTKRREMRTGPNLLVGFDGSIYWQFGFNEPEIQDPDKFILMQFTGLYDKNGKEIWEGDVVGHGWQNSEIGEVIWRGYGFRVERPGSSDLHFNHPEQFEVLGNVYEHGHLLNA